ncbi:lipopolysaccharide kinase InaA family protein [Sansalvadorimonas sp. 2012CJ34-2]|uniref:Lipopolysaccharide kinase InaA family protein n=1 Tax=Parendozoicomonas callyspongiae TaxID=2942213 RepID=A0ABT0PJQ5_9GAMM|nr:lipopolysaccharide kinase InaA family protein [Sansalvadorimonas sp. 2012CJ34-2]MCL6271617.1 lipopolysaccharide kinase InaA family protein [Sansalvadorimonas sp. 2012CJ34-2]
MVASSSGLVSGFLGNDIEATFRKEGLDNFRSLWNVNLQWFEAPNQRRKGWSGVCRMTLPGRTSSFYIKRQENHNTKTLLHPLSGIPTYRRELCNIQRFHANEIPTVTPIYYGERIISGKHQAILITVALDGYLDIGSINRQGNDSRTIPALQELGKVVRKMHDRGMAHYCLYPNHSFAKINGRAANIRLIDLEKARRDILESRRRFKDLECFMRHTEAFSLEAREKFISSYFSAGSVLSSEKVIRQRLDYLMTRPQR